LDKNKDNIEIEKAVVYKIQPALSANYYSILFETAPPPCLVKEQQEKNQTLKIVHHIQEPDIFNTFFKKRFLNSSFSYVVANSAAVSHVGTKHNHFICRLPEPYHGQTVIALAHRYHQTTNNVDRELTKLP
jgi:hypothetical protein